MEQIKAMLDGMSKDTAFAEKMQSLMQNGSTAGIIAAAGKKGFVFTETDWQAYLDWAKKVGRQSGEISPDELENITGGAGGDVGNVNIGGCWFFASGNAEMKDGHMRKRCRQYACKTNLLGAMAGTSWNQCGCFGTDRCKGSWHYEEGCS